jgi:hypothetical protein
MSAALLVLIALFVCVSVFVLADPTGSTISNAVTVYGPNTTPASRTDNRSTITTMVLNATIQTSRWKAYVGNVTGVLTLDNPSNMTIYAWDVTTLTGQVYASRYSNITWSSPNIICANSSIISAEATFNNMTGSMPDRINQTFNWSIHKQFQIGTNTIGQNNCSSTVTYMNDTRQVPTTSSPFQEVLLQDNISNVLIYMTSIDYQTQGYDNASYDFQMIVAESDVKASPTPYYFYVELR